MTDIKVGDWIKTPNGYPQEVRDVTDDDVTTTAMRIIPRRSIEEVRSPAPAPCMWRRLPSSIWSNKHQAQCAAYEDWFFCPYCGAPLQIEDAESR